MTVHAGQDILNEAMAWSDVTAHDHQFGGVAFRLGKRQLGHLHGDRIADIPLKRALRDDLVAAGRARIHRWQPDSGWVTIDIYTERGRDEAVRLLRLGYESARARPGRPPVQSQRSRPRHDVTAAVEDVTDDEISADFDEEGEAKQ